MDPSPDSCHCFVYLCVAPKKKRKNPNRRPKPGPSRSQQPTKNKQSPAGLPHLGLILLSGRQYPHFLLPVQLIELYPHHMTLQPSAGEPVPEPEPEPKPKPKIRPRPKPILKRPPKKKRHSAQIQINSINKSAARPFPYRFPLFPPLAPLPFNHRNMLEKSNNNEQERKGAEIQMQVDTICAAMLRYRDTGTFADTISTHSLAGCSDCPDTEGKAELGREKS